MSGAPPMDGLEAELRQRFATREEILVHAGCRLAMIMPRATDDLLDEAEFARDERIPYWAELWPAARVLARALLDAPPPRGPALELGCGLALPSLALLGRGADVTATDYYDDALLFARANARRNGLPDLATRLLDWRAPPADLGRFATVLAADVLYEERNLAPLCAALASLVADGGEVLLADPDRKHLPAFVATMHSAGWLVSELARVSERQAEAARPTTVVLLRLTR
jgi:ETFB lysine methyltransferase